MGRPCRSLDPKLTPEVSLLATRQRHRALSRFQLDEWRQVRAAFHAHSNWLQVSFLEREYVVVAHHNAERIVPEDRHAHCGDGAALEDTAEAFIRRGDLGVAYDVPIPRQDVLRY